MTLKKGLIEVYTGNGKGKTTASIGLAIRAMGRGLKVYMIQFMKAKGYGENQILKSLPLIKMEFVGKPYFITTNTKIKDLLKNVVVFEPGKPPEEYMKLIEKGVNSAENAIKSGSWDVIILDELNTAIHFGLIDVERIIQILKSKPEHVEVVLTGRYVPKELIEIADLVTDMQEVKHPYQKGILARKGIDF